MKTIRTLADRLKNRWQVRSDLELLVIFLVFSLAGMSILPLRRLVFHLLHVGETTPFILKFLLWLIIVFPAYQALLLFYGFLFGKFAFFWEKERKLVRWMFRIRSS